MFYQFFFQSQKLFPYLYLSIFFTNLVNVMSFSLHYHAKHCHGPLNLASAEGHATIVKVLLEAGSNLELADKDVRSM